MDGELKEVEAIVEGDGRGVRMGVVEGFWDAEGGEVALEDLVEDAQAVPVGVFDFVVVVFVDDLGEEILNGNLFIFFQEVAVDEVHYEEAVAFFLVNEAEVAHGHGPGRVVVAVAEINVLGDDGNEEGGEFFGGSRGEEIDVGTGGGKAQVGECVVEAGVGLEHLGVGIHLFEEAYHASETEEGDVVHLIGEGGSIEIDIGDLVFVGKGELLKWQELMVDLHDFIEGGDGGIGVVVAVTEEW